MQKRTIVIFRLFFNCPIVQVGCGVNNGSRGEHHQGVSGSQGGAGYASKGAKRGFPKMLYVKVQSGSKVDLLQRRGARA